MARNPVSYADLVIVGAGPAGMMAAAWASQFRIVTRVVDKNDTRCMKGRADGLQSRTLEIFDSFGVADGVWKQGFHDIEICTWTSEGNAPIQRTQRVLSQKVGISRYTQACINQGIIEQTFLDFLKINDRVHVERSVSTEQLHLDDSTVDRHDAYPITLKIRHVEKSEATSETNGVSGTKFYFQRDFEENARNTTVSGDADEAGVEIIKAKYLLGCDGAHSWTRRQLDLKLEGQQTEHLWGVMDIIPLTNFPDIRQACAIHSATHGSILNVPREDRLNRLYVQLNEEGSSFDRTQITPKVMLEAARRIMAPYELDFKYCDWWSVYQIGQRVAPQFSVKERIFLAGDAVHTHSPKLGQGMNVSMQDSYNLCWKLGAVISGIAKPEILKTYNIERRQVALDLLAVDREIARFYSPDRRKGLVSTDKDENGSADFGVLRNKMYEFLAGVGVIYLPSMLVSKPNLKTAVNDELGKQQKLISKQELAPNIKVGMRIPSYKVINQAEARPVHVADLLKSTGQWRIIVFAGDVQEPSQAKRVQHLGEQLALPNSLLRKYTPSSQRYDSVIELLTIHASPRESLSILDLHEIYHPYDEELGWDYWKVFVDDVSYHEGFDEAYVRYGINRQEGCIVVCRPDQHVGYIGALEDIDDLETYFAGILLPQT